MPHLKRELGLFETVMLGLGIIVGAGIYALIGIGGVEAGNSLWLAFAIAGVVAFLTALSYAELCSMFPKAGSSYYYAKNAFNSREIGFILGWVMIVSYVTGSTTVALGFGQYFHSLVPQVSEVVVAVSLLGLLGAVNVWGLKRASTLNLFCDFFELLGLAIIIAFAVAFATPNAGFEMPKGFDGIVTASLLAFFAFLGFEVLATSAEEVKNVRKTLPKAILISVLIVLVLYIVTAVSFTSLLSYGEIVSIAQQEQGALAVAAGKYGGPLALSAVAAIALFATLNTVLVSILGASRMTYGIARDKALPDFLNHVSARQTPANAVYFVTIASMLLALLGDIKLVAEATVVCMFLVFLVDNAAVIALRLKQPHAERGFKIPLNVKNVPLTALAAIAAILLILAKTCLQSPILALIALGVIISGFLVYEGEEKAKEIKGKQ
ncbi:amino acid permease [Candidatus Micrarchaeota archaeon]|nr:amino acid permease [Candidatus Micrarchaeota archaeon]